MTQAAGSSRAIRVFRDAIGVEQAVALRWIALGRAAIAEKGRFNVALAGGSTPKGLYARLSREYRDQLDWSGVRFYWGDERCVSGSDPQSNWGMAHRELLAPLTIPASNVYPMDGSVEPSVGARRYAELLGELPRTPTGVPKFDLILLGLGKDVHTASLFPGATRGLDSVEGEWVVPGVGPEGVRQRLTLTLDVINGAACVAFMAVGAEKTEALRQALSGKRRELPASLVAPHWGAVEWYVDDAAWGEMTKIEEG